MPEMFEVDESEVSLKDQTLLGIHEMRLALRETGFLRCSAGHRCHVADRRCGQMRIDPDVDWNLVQMRRIQDA